MRALFTIGRVIFGGFFLYSGINHFKQREALAGYSRSKGIPSPDQSVTLSGAALLAGGSSLVFGIQPALGAAAIAVFLASASPLMHDFWRAQDPNQRSNDMINFTKNMALLGAALMLIGLERR